MLEYVYSKIKHALRTLDMKLERAKYGYIDKLPKDINNLKSNYTSYMKAIRDTIKSVL